MGDGSTVVRVEGFVAKCKRMQRTRHSDDLSVAWTGKGWALSRSMMRRLTKPLRALLLLRREKELSRLTCAYS